MKIYFCFIHFDRTVHAHALGFTRHIPVFIFGDDEEHAKERATKYYREKYDLGIIELTAKLAFNQNRETYVEII